MEQLTIFFLALVNEYDPDGLTIFMHFPITTGDWFNLCHSAVVMILFLVL